MKKLARIVLLLIVVSLILTLVLSAFSFAEIRPGDIQGSGTVNIGTAEQGLNKLGGAILGALRLFGSIAAVVIMAIYGIQWFLAAPNDKAKLKDSFWGYFIGAVFVFGGAQIMGWIAAAFQNI